MSIQGVEHAGSAEDAGTAPYLDAPLAEPAGAVVSLGFKTSTLAALRQLVARYAARCGLESERIADLVLAANEVATNSVRHGDGSGVARLWCEDGTLICEISDQGVFAHPLADRVEPGAAPEAARGLWLVDQLCDLVQLRTSAAGTVLRLHLQLPRR